MRSIHTYVSGEKMEVVINAKADEGSPRVGGEKLLQESLYGCEMGSPPRRRGKKSEFERIALSKGITPA